MNSRRVSYDESSDGSSDPNHRDRTLRALEGRTDDDYSQMTPPDSAEATPDENTADIFMSIAREDSSQRSPGDTGGGEEHSAIVSDTILGSCLDECPRDTLFCHMPATVPSVTILRPNHFLS